ncbi:MAG TPA: DUF1565 domain-containing protein, partial [Myxococcales bacterium]|nr:DUF1565 domain-containing protein [Myxococcales bacterium]
MKFCASCFIAAIAFEASAAAQREVHASVLYVAAPRPGENTHAAAGNGSAGAPFQTIADALQAAPPGALIRIAEGTYPEAVLIARPVVLLGAGRDKTKIVGPTGARATAVRTGGGVRVELRDLTVEQAAAAISAEGGSMRLENVALRALDDAALVARDSQIVFSNSEVTDVGGGVTGVALEIDGGSLEMRRSVIRAGGRRAIKLRRGHAVLEAVDVSRSGLAALQVLDGAEVAIEDGRFEWFGGAALYAG